MTRTRQLSLSLAVLASTLIGLLRPQWGDWLLARAWGWYKPQRPHRSHRKHHVRPRVPYHNHRDLVSLLRNQGMQPNPARKLAEQVYSLKPASFDEAVKLALQINQKGS